MTSRHLSLLCIGMRVLFADAQHFFPLHEGNYCKHPYYSLKRNETWFDGTNDTPIVVTGLSNTSSCKVDAERMCREDPVCVAYDECYQRGWYSCDLCNEEGDATLDGSTYYRIRENGSTWASGHSTHCRLYFKKVDNLIQIDDHSIHTNVDNSVDRSSTDNSVHVGGDVGGSIGRTNVDSSITNKNIEGSTVNGNFQTGDTQSNKTFKDIWTPGCEWIPKDNCKDDNKWACTCRSENPSGPCTPCQAGGSQRKVTADRRQLDSFGNEKVEADTLEMDHLIFKRGVYLGVWPIVAGAVLTVAVLAGRKWRLAREAPARVEQLSAGEAVPLRLSDV